MKEIFDNFGLGMLELVGFAVVFVIILSCIKAGGPIYNYVQTYMSSICG